MLLKKSKSSAADYMSLQMRNGTSDKFAEYSARMRGELFIECAGECRQS